MHIFYDLIFGGIYAYIQYQIARDWVYWDNSPSYLNSFVSLNYIFVFLAFRFSQFLPREIMHGSRGGMMISSFFAVFFAIYYLSDVLSKDFRVGDLTPNQFFYTTVIILMILSAVLFIYFVGMTIYWMFFERNRDDEEKERLRKENELRSDEYRRYGNKPRTSKGTERELKSDV